MDTRPIELLRGGVPALAWLGVTALLVHTLYRRLFLRATPGVDVTAPVATSAALSIVLGFAMQETLGLLGGSQG